MRLKGKRAIVTGGASGIGAAITARFAAEGARVTAADIDHESLRTGEEGASRVRVDVTEEDSVIALIEAAEHDGPVDVLVNVAGVGSTTTAPDTPLEVWEQVMAVNARGTFLCCKHAIPRMAQRRRGAIVNIASVAALVGFRNRAAYCASKGAVLALTRAMALDHVADGVRVNCVCPGTIDSPWVRRLVADAGESFDDLRARQPMARLGTPEEVAEAALYLAGDGAGFVTGSALTIDGGITAQ
jgi:NAD(P)-dependent dehydrogenase (short-subunit alcohol dehydrogenase family)